MLAALSEQHDFNIVAVEVLTGGWCTKSLHILKKLSSFMKKVDYICLGKWMGIVLCNKELMNDIGENTTGETTGTNYNETKKALEEVIPLLGKITEWRELVLKLLKMDENDTWDD
eukprot:9651523-Ditylum_brightwellii.AAC.1